MLTDAEIEAAIQERQVPKLHQGTYRRAMKGNRPAAVKALCLECQGWEDGAVDAVRNCESVGCPLHAVRPYRA